jgi:N-carbamoyl-L-amino-acid hydrolase
VRTVDPRVVIVELHELRALTGDAGGAQRVAFTPTWAAARAWFRGKLTNLPIECELDEAANLWVTLRGRSDRELLIGSHLDSVPDGGRLDGCLGVVAGLEVLRRIAAEGVPPVTVRLVDWADEEGARFGRSLFGSSAASGSMDPEAVRDLTDSQGIRLEDAVRDHGVDLDRIGAAARRLERAAAYLELHIEQGPVLESMDLPLGVVLGTVGIERHRIRFVGQTAHAGSTPMALRRDAFAAAARMGLEIREIARRGGGVGTVGSCVTRPGIPTAVAGCCELTLDQRHLDAGRLADMLREAQASSARIAGEEGVAVEWSLLWRIPPIAFDAELIEMADAAVREVAGVSHRLPSGPLHDAAEMARAGVPAAMLFVQSLRGLSHTREEDTRDEHLEIAVEALDRLANKAMSWIAEP